MTRRVVITGMGTVNPIGKSVDEFWRSLIAGRSGIAPVTHFDTTGFNTTIAGEVADYDTSHFLEKKDARRMALFIKFAVDASLQAVKNSGLNVAAEAFDVGVIIGSGIGGIEILEEASNILRDKGPSRVGPFTVPMMIANMAAGQVGISTGAKGPNSCLVTACASATHSIGAAYHFIKRQEAVAMICGGSEAAITPVSMAAFCAARAMSTNNQNPLAASRPFDKQRDGFVMGEGAGILVIEELEHAQARGARVYAELVGYGETGDAYHITSPAPEGEGGMRAMARAIQSAGIRPDQIDHINAHGTSTQLNDKFETQAIKAVFGSHAPQIAINSTKSMTGHLLGAAGGVEAIAVALTLVHQTVPPTINYTEPDPECDLYYTPNVAVQRPVQYAMSNSFGFGGQNSVLILKRFS